MSFLLPFIKIAKKRRIHLRKKEEKVFEMIIENYANGGVAEWDCVGPGMGWHGMVW